MLSTVETFLIAMLMIFAVPYLIWRVGKTEYFAPLVVIQIIVGILLGPGILGSVYPEYYQLVMNPLVLQSLNGLAWWAVMLFVWIAGIELDLKQSWKYRVESGVTAGLALSVPMLLGSAVGIGMVYHGGWIGDKAMTWQFVLGIGMSCAVTALPILILFLEKLEILRHPMGQRILRYASLDDIAIWSVLAFILMDWQRLGKQAIFLVLFASLSYLLRKLMLWLKEPDRLYVGMVWLALCALGADWAGLHFMVGAFLAGVVMDGEWFNQEKMDMLRHHVLLVMMPVFFLSTGIKTNWVMGGEAVFVVAVCLLIAAVVGKLIGVHLAAKILKWPKGEASIIAWLLQTKALIMIIFANVLLDSGLITSAAFTALLLMAIGSTMLTIPIVTPKLRVISKQ